jgi:serine/threonine protein kinase
VMLFHALTGRLPFVGRPQQVLAHRQQRRAPDPRSFGRVLPEELCALCDGLLEREPEQRWGAVQIFSALRGR